MNVKYSNEHVKCVLRKFLINFTISKLSKSESKNLGDMLMCLMKSKSVVLAAMARKMIGKDKLITTDEVLIAFQDNYNLQTIQK